MVKKIIGNLFLKAINKRNKYLLGKFANRIKVTNLIHADVIYNSIINTLKRDNKTAYNAFKKIEEERKTLSNDLRILDDGSLGEPGLYDGGLTISQVNGASKPKVAAEFLGLLALNTSAETILELGTNTGISSAYMSILLNQQKPNFNFVTLDASAYRQRVAKSIHKKLGIKNVEYVCGLFIDTLQSTLDNNKKWDLVFIDGHHQYQPTLDYFDMIYPHCNKNAIIIFDDIIWSTDMRKAWEKLKADKRFLYCVDMYKIGIGVLAEEDNNSPKLFNMFQEETVKLF